jgi:hypothetical protein
VESLPQPDREIYRGVVLGASGRELLVVASDRGLLLPWVDIPRDQRVAESLTRAMKTDWGCETICLFTPHVASSAGRTSEVRYQAMECCRKTHDPRTKWVLLSSLLRNDLANVADYAAVLQSAVECLAHVGGEAPGPFARIGWLTQLQEWVEEVVTPLGLHLSGRFCQLNASPCFSLIRLETNGPAIWFKAVGEPNPREFPITLTLSELFPKYLPPVLATRSAWQGWLAREVEGTSLGETGDAQHWKDAASALAQVQIASIGHQLHLLQCGARDLRISSLSNLVDPFLEAVGGIMERQVKVPPPVLTRSELLILGEQILDTLSIFLELGLPDALGHLDLNPGNIIASADGCVFLDWAEAYVGNPFLSFQYLLEHFRRTACADLRLEREIIASYAKGWRTILSADDIAEALRLAPMLAVFAYAAGTGMWADPGRLQDQKSAGFLRSLTRRLHRETSLAMEWRPPCLS